MIPTYDITLDVRGDDLSVKLTRPSAFDVLFGDLYIPDFFEHGRDPETSVELEEYHQFAMDIIEKVSDLPLRVAECLPPLELGKLVYACAKVYAGDKPELDEYDPGDDSAVSESEVEDNHALAANSYPHFETAEEETDDVGFDRKSEKPGTEIRTVARGE